MDLSILLAKVLGLYLMIVSVSVFVRRKELDRMVDAFFRDNLFVFFSGTVILLLGLALVLIHNVWETSWRGVITAIGWLTVLKGGVRLLAPAFAQEASKKAVGSAWYWGIIALAFAAGAYLAYTGFSHEP